MKLTFYIFVFCFKMLDELVLHVCKVTGEEADAKEFESKWQQLLPYLCEEGTAKGGFLHN